MLHLLQFEVRALRKEAIEEIRNAGHHADLPIIVVSAYVDVVLTPELLDAQEIIKKPFGVQHVMDAVKGCFQKGSRLP